jgi:hypothetical protein
MPPKRRKVKAKAKRRVENGQAAAAVAQVQTTNDAIDHNAGANRKRRPADDAPTSENGSADSSSKESGTNHRGSRAERREIIDRMRSDPRYATVDKAEAQRLREEVASKLVVMDTDTGEQREVDVSNKDDIEYLIKNQGADVLSRDEEALGKFPKDMKTGMVALRRENLPDDLNNTGVLPLGALALKKYMRDAANSLSDILLWMPLINVPVFTPKLQQLLMVDTPTWPTQDSFQQLRTYIAVLKLLTHSETTRTRGREALDWLATRVEDRTVAREDIACIFEHASFKPQPRAIDEVGEDDDDGGEMWVRQMYHDHLRNFDDRTYASEHIDELYTTVLTVERYDGAPWVKQDIVFAEDIMEEHVAAGQQLCAEVGGAIDQIEDQTDAAAILGVVMTYTVRLLRLYEVAIMRVLSHASLIGDTIPEKYFGELASKTDVLPEPGEVHVAVRKLVRSGREEITKVRAEAIGVDIPPPNSVHESDEDNAHADVVPSIEELYFYVHDFLNYNANEESDLVEVVERMQNAVHITEPAPIVEGMSVPEGDAEVNDADAVQVAEGDIEVDSADAVQAADDDETMS